MSLRDHPGTLAQPRDLRLDLARPTWLCHETMAFGWGRASLAFSSCFSLGLSPTAVVASARQRPAQAPKPRADPVSTSLWDERARHSLPLSFRDSGMVIGEHSPSSKE